MGVATGIFILVLFFYFGLTSLIYGLAFGLSDEYPNWLAAIAFLGGTLGFSSALFTYFDDFSDPVYYGLFIPSAVVFLIWVFIASIILWRRELRVPKPAKVKATSAAKPKATAPPIDPSADEKAPATGETTEPAQARTDRGLSDVGRSRGQRPDEYGEGGGVLRRPLLERPAGTAEDFGHGRRDHGELARLHHGVVAGQGVHQRRRRARPRQTLPKGLVGDVDVTDFATERAREDGCAVGRGDGLGAGQLVRLAVVPIRGEHLGGHRADVGGVDHGVAPRSRRLVERPLGLDGVAPHEGVGHEDTRPQDRPRQRRRPELLLTRRVEGARRHARFHPEGGKEHQVADAGLAWRRR